MAQSPLDSGPVVGTSDKENIAAGYERLGNVTLEEVRPGVTGDMVAKAMMSRTQALTALANGISEGFSPLIDSMAKGVKEQQSGADYAAGAQAGLAGSDAPAASSVGSPPASQVTRDQSGGQSVIPSLGGLFGGDPAAAVSKSYAAGHASSESITVADAAQKIRLDNEGSPEGFKQAWGGFVQGRNYDALGQQYGTAAKLYAIKVGDEHYRDLLAKQTSANMIASGHAVQTDIDSVSADMSTLARNGKINSPQYDNLQDRLQDRYAALAANPASGLSKVDADNQLAQKLNGFLGDHVSSLVDNAYQQGGKTAAIKAATDGVNAIPNLSNQDRATITQQASSRVAYIDGLNADSIQANRQATDHTIKMANSGAPVSPPSYGALSNHAIMTGDPATVAIIAGHVPATAVNPIKAGLTPSQSGTALAEGQPAPAAPIGGPTRQAAAYNYFVGKGWSANASHAMVATLSGESGRTLNTGAYQGEGGFGPSGTSWDRLGGVHAAEAASGIANWNTPRAMALKSWATANGKDPSSFNTQLEYVDKEARQYGLPITSTASPAALTSAFTGKYEAPAVNNGAARWANYAKGNLAGGGAQASVSGQPFTPEHVAANPMAAAPYTASVASDPGVRAKTANDLGGSIERSLQNHTLPPPETMAQYVQLSAGDPKEQERASRISSAAGLTPGSGGGGSQVSGDGGPAGPETYQQAVSRLAGGHDLFQAGIGGAIQQQHADATAALAHDPIGYAARAKMIDPSQTPGPINYNDPASISQGIQARAAIIARVAGREPGISLSAIPEAEKPQLTDWMTYGPPQTAQAILDSIKNLPPPSRDATLADPTIAKAVVNMAHSGDVTRAGAANDLLTEAWKSNPQTFDRRFGEDASSDLAAWHSVGQFQTPEERIEAAKASSNPSVIKSRNDEVAIANKMTPQSVANALSPAWLGPNATPGDSLSGTALKGQYDDLFREQYLKTGDASAAKDYALGKLATTWGASGANDGRVMMHPPEYSSAYPPVDGDKSYIGKQLADDVARLAPGSSDHYLIPDQRTADEMHSGTAPTYQVVIKDANGRWGALPSRFVADPKQAMDEAEEKFGTRHTAMGILGQVGMLNGRQ